MKHKIITIVTMLTLSLSGSWLIPAVASANCAASDNSSQGQVLKGIGENGGTDCKDAQKTVTNFANTIVTIISFVAGIAAVIMIIVSGLKYITSGGDSGKVSSAKNTLIYALIGVVVAVLAQLLVHFVLYRTNKAVSVILLGVA